jgi:hypothetical protein
MGISVGFGVGPVRVSKRIGGGRRRSSSGPGFFATLGAINADIEKAIATERYETAARMVVDGSREPEVVAAYLEGKARNARSAERRQFTRNQVSQIRQGYDFNVKIGSTGTVTVKVLEGKRVTMDTLEEFRAQISAHTAKHFSQDIAQAERNEIYFGWASPEYRANFLASATDGQSPEMVAITSQEIARYMDAWRASAADADLDAMIIAAS